MSPSAPETDSSASSSNLIVRSDRPMRMAGFACLGVLLTAVYVGFDVNRAIGQNKDLYDVAIPAIRLLSDIEFETQEARHAMMHATGNLDPIFQQRYLTEFSQRRQRVDELLALLDKLRIPPPIRPRISAFVQQWNRYVQLSRTLVPSAGPGQRDRQFQETTIVARSIHDALDVFAKSSAAAVRFAFLRAGFELVLLLLATLHMISVLATNGEKRKALESLRLLNQRLQSARVAAEESSKLKSEFLATVSHEIRTPMNGIIGMAELLSRSGLNEEQRSYNETVRLSAEALLSILNDILDFSRIEAGKLVIEATTFSPSEPALQMADLLAPAAAARGLEFVVRVSPNLPRTIVGDAGRIRQVLMNLTANAIKFTHSGHVKVEVEALATTDTTCRIRFAVEDTGIGIAKANMSGLFEKFTQADASTTRRYGGTGLGLAISRKLVELMGGSLEVNSEAGQGSIFSMELTVPVGEGWVAEQSPFAESGPPVLVLEPSEVSATAIVEMLTQLGAVVKCTRLVDEAISILEKSASHWQAVLVSSRVQTSQPALFVRIQRLLGKGGRLIVMAPRGRVDPKLVAREVRVVTKPLQLATLEAALRSTLIETSPVIQPARCVTTASSIRDLNALANSVGVPRNPTSVGLRVLVAEDNIVNQTIVRKLLEEAGCTVDLVANGQQAVAQWEDGVYDLILMDCQMPELDGFEATREIRRREVSGERVPIIAITANVLDKDRTHCFAAGMDDFLSKPLRMTKLQDVVAKWTSGRGVATRA